MNNFYLYLFFILIFFFAIVFQTTLVSPQNAGIFYIDFSLIALIYISLIPEISGLIFLALLSGYTIDVLSAADIGIYTISRLSLYIMLRLLITKVYSDKFFVEFGIILLSIIYEWILIFLLSGLGSSAEFSLSLNFIIKNILINAFAGYIFFLLLKEIHERIKA